MATGEFRLASCSSGSAHANGSVWIRSRSPNESCCMKSAALVGTGKRWNGDSSSTHFHARFHGMTSTVHLFTKCNASKNKGIQFRLKEHSVGSEKYGDDFSTPSIHFFSSRPPIYRHPKPRRRYITYAENDDTFMQRIAMVKPFFEQYIPIIGGRDKVAPERENVENESNGAQPHTQSNSETDVETSSGASTEDFSTTNAEDKENFNRNTSPELDSMNSFDDEEGIEKDADDDPQNLEITGQSKLNDLSVVYLKTKSLLTSLTKGVKTLDEGIVRREKELDYSSRQIDDMLDSLSSQNSSGNASREAVERFRKLVFEFQELQRQAAIKDKTIENLKKEGEVTRQKLRIAEEAAGEAEFLKREIEIRHEEKLNLHKELSKAEEKGESLSKEIESLKYDIRERDTLINKLQEEAILSSNALQTAAKAMVAARDRTLRMEEQLEKTGDLLAKERINSGKIKEKFIDSSADLAEAKEAMKNIMLKMQLMEKEAMDKQELLEKSKLEAERSTKLLELTSTSLEQAQLEIEALRVQLDSVQNTQTLVTQDQEEKELLKQSQLYEEISSLKAMLEANELTIKGLKAENSESATLRLEAENSRKELLRAETTIQQLENQIESLEKELSQQTTLLSEIKDQNEKTTEILKTAANYKKELNEAKDKELDLMEKLQERELMIEELRQELAYSAKSAHNDMITRQIESRAEESEKEVLNLRKAITARDTAIELMKKQLQKTAHLLSSSVEAKETIKQMQIQIDLLNIEIEEKNEHLMMLEDELSILRDQETSLRYQDRETNYQYNYQYDDNRFGHGHSNTF